jgi:hypothetical protein
VSRGEGPTLHYLANELDSQLCLPTVLFEISRDLRHHRWTTAFRPSHVTSQCHVCEGPTLNYPANEVDSQLCLPSVLFEKSRDLQDIIRLQLSVLLT